MFWIPSNSFSSLFIYLFLLGYRLILFLFLFFKCCRRGLSQSEIDFLKEVVSLSLLAFHFLCHSSTMCYNFSGSSFFIQHINGLPLVSMLGLMYFQLDNCCYKILRCIHFIYGAGADNNFYCTEQGFANKNSPVRKYPRNCAWYEKFPF